MTLMSARVMILGDGVIFIPKVCVFVPRFSSFFGPRAMTLMLARVTILGTGRFSYPDFSKSVYLFHASVRFSGPAL
jgi:hypothetical protein